ncbi:MAG: cyclic-di-AMP receptor [Dictyoglomus sp.]|nr:cyclic-di-AMP receptor [Dictyoglomus sp.]MCX7942843.1 cyclic-di-AMP receptor [Dictyoglomaceae bacterium]MDW8188349.1 cyclic-di-AMP receptor [Dictyoglomus sp.]
MKLILAVIQEEDWKKIREIFIEKNLPFTFFKSKGGFLQEASITILTVVEEEKLEEVLTILKENCKEREKVIIPPLPSVELLRSVPMPVKIKVGGAVVIVLEVSHFEKI